MPSTIITTLSFADNIGSESLTGFFFIIPSLDGSVLNPTPGAVSMITFDHKTCIAVNEAPGPKIGESSTVTTFPMLFVMRYFIAFFMLLYTVRPSFTADTIVEKLSSASMILLASCDTCEPALPIAIPTSARFNAGASLTPSPVMATTWPLSLSFSTILSLSSGATLEYTLRFSTCNASCSSSSFSRSLPSIV